MSKVCQNCATFKRIGNKCWFYWDNKKTCSQYIAGDYSEPTFKTVEENVIWL